MTKHIDMLAVGGAYVDINCTDFPFGDDGLAVETEIVGDEYEIVPGGAALNFARFGASLGLSTTFVGKVGRDKMGELLAELLRESGVQPAFIVNAEASTNISFNLVNGAGMTVMAVAGNAKQRLTGKEVEARILPLLPATEYLMLGGLFKLKALLPVLRPIAAAARAAKTSIVVDHSRFVHTVTPQEAELMRDLILTQADYYLPSRDEFLQLWGVTSIEEGLRQLAEQSRVVTVVKDSGHGAFTLHKGEIVHLPAFAVKPINTVGAGDCFNAGFIAAQKEGQDVVSSMRFACAAAALKISHPGLPTHGGVRAFVQRAALAE